MQECHPLSLSTFLSLWLESVDWHVAEVSLMGRFYRLSVMAEAAKEGEKIFESYVLAQGP